MPRRAAPIASLVLAQAKSHITSSNILDAISLPIALRMPHQCREGPYVSRTPPRPRATVCDDTNSIQQQEPPAVSLVVTRNLR